MRVLVVDDEKAVADSTILVFRIFGHQAEAVYSAEEALAAVQHFQPDLLVSDVKMSGMNGIELAIRLCAERPCYSQAKPKLRICWKKPSSAASISRFLPSQYCLRN